MRLAWLTDIHLNFLRSHEVDAFFDHVAGSGADAVLVTGDIAVAPTLARLLRRLAQRVARPVYFVLGNHDFWGSSVADTQRAMTALTDEEGDLVWLPARGAIALTDRTALLGHDGWYDGRFGDYASSPIRLNDFVRMDDFAYQGHAARLETMQALSQEAADHIVRHLPDALERFEHVLIATHVPPFREAAWHEGRISDDDWLPFMSSKVVGEAIRDVLGARPDRRATVLCGHTHGAGEATILPNLRVRTGGASYGAPELQQPLVQVE